ncbi:MAG: hypothetical protein AB7O66_16615 [Limisphaerales bacterium]
MSHPILRSLLVCAALGCAPGVGADGLEAATSETRAMIQELDAREAIGGRAFLIRAEAFQWQGRRLDIPFIQRWREILGAGFTQAGAVVTSRPGGEACRVRGNVTSDGTWLDLNLWVDVGDRDGGTLALRRRIPEADVRRYLVPEPAQLAAYLVQSVERQNRGFAIPVRTLPPEPEAGAVPRNLGSWLQSEILAALSQAQALQALPPATTNSSAHELRVRYARENQSLRFVITVGRAGEHPWGQATVALPMDSFPTDSIRVRFAEPLLIAWTTSTNAGVAEGGMPEALLATLNAKLRDANLSVTRVDSASEPPAEAYRLQARYVPAFSSGPGAGPRRATVRITGSLQPPGGGGRIQAWQSSTTVYIRASSGEPTLPVAAHETIASDAADEIHNALAQFIHSDTRPRSTTPTNP